MVPIVSIRQLRLDWQQLTIKELREKYHCSQQTLYKLAELYNLPPKLKTRAMAVDVFNCETSTATRPLDCRKGKQCKNSCVSKKVKCKKK